VRALSICTDVWWWVRLRHERIRFAWILWRWERKALGRDVPVPEWIARLPMNGSNRPHEDQ
jgi:hypothetical protein